LLNKSLDINLTKANIKRAFPWPTEIISSAPQSR
jgi:hypothetical protein